MPNMKATPQQIQTAATAGVELLSDKELKVPLGIAIGGQLSILQSILASLATGDLILVNPPTPDQQAAAGEKTEDSKPPPLASIDGNKQDENEG